MNKLPCSVGALLLAAASWSAQASDSSVPPSAAPAITRSGPESKPNLWQPDAQVSQENILPVILPKAKQGDKVAQRIMGDAYRTGYGVTEDLYEAFFWYSLAAELGDTEAEMKLAGMYINGYGTRQNRALALEWAMKAAAQKSSAAELALAKLYTEGNDQEKDDSQALIWLNKASDQGNAEAQYTLGVKLEDGSGAPQNLPAAAQLYQKAAEQGFPDAQFRLGRLYALGKALPQDVKKAELLWQASSDQGNQHARAQLDLWHPKDPAHGANSCAVASGNAAELVAKTLPLTPGTWHMVGQFIEESLIISDHNKLKCAINESVCVTKQPEPVSGKYWIDDKPVNGCRLTILKNTPRKKDAVNVCGEDSTRVKLTKAADTIYQIESSGRTNPLSVSDPLLVAPAIGQVYNIEISLAGICEK